MRPPHSISHRKPRACVRRRHSCTLFVPLLLITLCTDIRLRAQDAPPPQPDGSAPYVLHLYARLVELPTFIFIRSDKPPTLDPKQINIKLTAATLKTTQSFHPLSTRLQGNDPLSIAILFDVSGDQTKFLAALQKDFSGWITRSLRPQDHVSLYALDCNIIQTSNDVPASNASLLQGNLDVALASPLSHDNSGKPSCGNSIRLRGSILFVMRKLSQLPGRRILIVVTGGRDGKSNITWPVLGTEAGLDSVTAFGLSSHGPFAFENMREIYNFTQQTGGLLFTPEPADLPKTMDRVITLLRGRYILQFPMPHDTTPVEYRVNVTVPKYDAYILTSGISVPLPHQELDHPTTDLPAATAPPNSAPQATDPLPTTPPPAAPPATTPHVEN